MAQTVPMFQRNMAASQFLVPTPMRNFAASEKELKQRMKSVNNIRKITKAMKMVATSKMKADLTRLLNGKDFGISSVDMLFTCDKYMKDRAPETPKDCEELIVTLTSDKGMCGGINSGVFRNVRDYVKRGNRNKIQIFSIGDKGTIAFQRPMADILKVGISEI